MVGGHYTYAEVPLFDWIKEVLDQSRNKMYALIGAVTALLLLSRLHDRQLEKVLRF